MVTGFYAGILGLWLVYLVADVVRQRFKQKVGLGHGGKAALMKKIRVHGNFIETVPYVLIIMFLLEAQDYADWLLHVFGGGLVLSRVLHWYGISGSTGTSFGRAAGTAIMLMLIIIGSLILMAEFLTG